MICNEAAAKRAATIQKILFCLCTALVLAGILLIVLPGDHTGDGSGLVRASSRIQFGGDFYTTSAQYTALAANAVVDTYKLIKVIGGIFFVFLGAVGDCLMVLFGGNPWKATPETTISEAAEAESEETLCETE